MRRDGCWLLAACPATLKQMRPSPEQATAVLHLILVERAFSSLENEVKLFAKVIGTLFMRVKVTLFYEKIHSIPTLYRSRSNDSLNESLDLSSDEEDQLGDDEDWGKEVGDDGKIATQPSQH